MHNLERDKFLTEAMGECWHEWRYRSYGYYQASCVKCGVQAELCKKMDNDFSTWEGFGKLWTWAQKQYWWFDTVRWDLYVDDDGITNAAYFIQESLVNPDMFANAVYEYLKGGL